MVRLGRRNGGTTLVFRLSRGALLRITIVRVYPSCDRVGSYAVRAHAGVNRIPFRGQWRGRALAPGGYRLIVRARGARRAAASVPIAVARGKTSETQLRRARVASGCSAELAAVGAPASTAGLSGGDDDKSVLAGAVDAIKAPIEGAAELVTGSVKGVTSAGGNAAKRALAAADDPFEDPALLTVVGLITFAIALLGLLVLTYLARLSLHERHFGRRT